MSGISSTDPLADAKQLCEEHGGLVIETVTDNYFDKQLGCWRYPTCWKVFRKLPGGRRTYLGKRRNAVGLLRLVRSLV